MLSVNAALERVLSVTRRLDPRRLDSALALGLILAEDISADVDSPPHNKSLVDGYAVRAADIQPSAALLMIEEVVAGGVPRLEVRAGQATRIMTGAPVPRGADAVIMVERTRIADESRVLIDQDEIQPGQNILPQAASFARGDRVLHHGAELRSIELGLLAEVGRGHVRAYPLPQVAVLATGNELTEANDIPQSGRIRNSNGPMLLAAVRSAGGEAVDLGVARDDAQELRAAVENGLSCDVLVVSGGVSAGTLDLAPSVFQSLQVQQEFHKVAMKPGKPLWFGRFEKAGRRTLVFGLPGNPVSSYVAFEVFVRPALAMLAGRTPKPSRLISASLTADLQQKGPRTTFQPATLERIEVGEQRVEFRVTPLLSRGSADLFALSKATSLIVLAPGDRLYRQGEHVQTLELPGRLV